MCWARGYALPRGWTSWGHLAIGGLLANVAPYFLFAVGEHLTSSAYAGILNGTTPLWTALTMTVVTRALPRRLQLAGLAVGFLGTVLIFEPWSRSSAGTLAGVLACLVAAALYGVCYIYLARYVTPLPANPVAVAARELGAAAVLSLALVPIDGGRISTATPSAVLTVLLLGVAGTGLAYVLNHALLTAEGPTATSLVAYLIPIVAAALGVLVLGEHLPPFAGAGAALVLVGVALVRRRRARPGSPVIRSPCVHTFLS